MRVLLVEDEPALAEAVAEHVSEQGHAVDRVARMADAEAALRAVAYQLVLLDLRLPDGNGLDLLRHLRRLGDNRPVIVLTARDRIGDRIEGLNAGADDYLVKPFDLDELAARVAAVSRRAAGRASPELHVGELRFDCAARRIWRAGVEVALTRREWAILELLAQRPGAMVSKTRIEEALYAFGSEVESNSVEAHISRIRKKLGRDLIQTARGLGYCLAVAP
jgi:DNA-binding response OmpR family regulator